MVDPNIKKKADDIRNETYGKEVRESLASGLEEMSSDVVETVGRQDEVEGQFQDVIENTTGKDVISAPEIIAARGGEANLKTRIDKDYQEVTAQLAHKADESDVRKDTSLQPINVSEMDTETKQLFTGGAVAVVDENMVGSENMKRNAIGDRESKFPLVRTEKGTNLFDKTSVINGFYVGYGSGNLNPASVFSASDWIDVLPDTEYTMSHRGQTAFYDVNMKYIDGFDISSGGKYTFTTPPNTTYLRVSTQNVHLDTQQINRGSELLPYVEGTPVMSGKHLKEESVSTSKFDENTLNILTSIQKGSNLFNKNDVIEGYYVGQGSGNLNEASVYTASGWIDVLPNTEYVIAHRDQSAFYDVNKRRIGGFDILYGGKYTFTTPPKTAYLRVSTQKINLDTQQINMGSELYTPSETKPYKGLNMFFLGDSITFSSEGWPYYVINEVEPKAYERLALPSATMKDRTNDPNHSQYEYNGRPYAEGEGNNNTFGNQVQKILDNKADYSIPDLILVAFGTNDDVGQSPEDIESQFSLPLDEVDRTTWAGAMRYGIETLSENYPNAKIMVCTPIQTADDYPGKGYKVTKQKRDIIIEICERLSVEVIDSFNCGIYGRNEAFNQDGKYLLDGLHPNDFGRKVHGFYNTTKIVNAFNHDWK